MTPQELIAITGQRQLFLGIGTYSWTLDQFKQAAQFARARGVDCLLIKTHEGALPAWYDGIGGWNAVRSAIQSEGVGAIPYIFSYGNKFGALDNEIDILLSHMQDGDIVCLNAEEAWNGQVAWAQHLCSRIQGQAGTFMVSTWADPSLQNWQGVIAALAPCTTVWMPQQYNNYLATCWTEFGINGVDWLQPTVNLTQDFGANDPVAIAKAAHDQGHTAISVWYYDTAVANPALLDAVYAAFPKSIQGGDMSLQLADPFAATYFTGDDTKWHCAATNCDIIGGILTFYRQIQGAVRLPKSNEQYDIANVAYQSFEAGFIVYDPQNQLGKPAGAGDCYMVMLNSDLGQRLTGLQSARTALSVAQEQITALQSQIANSTMNQDVKAMFAIFDKLKANVGA
jgi:hypothetical protein